MYPASTGPRKVSFFRGNWYQVRSLRLVPCESGKLSFRRENINFGSSRASNSQGADADGVSSFPGPIPVRLVLEVPIRTVPCRHYHLILRPCTCYADTRPPSPHPIVVFPIQFPGPYPRVQSHRSFPTTANLAAILVSHPAVITRVVYVGLSSWLLPGSWCWHCTALFRLNPSSPVPRRYSLRSITIL